MQFYIICLLMKVIINLKIGHKDLFVAFNVILVLWNIFLKCFYETLHVFVFCCCCCFVWRVRRLCFLVYHVAFSSISQDKCFSSLKFWIFIWWKFFFFSWWRYILPRQSLDQQCNHGELLFGKAIFIDNFWGSVAFKKLLNFFGLLSYRNCKFWRALWKLYAYY